MLDSTIEVGLTLSFWERRMHVSSESRHGLKSYLETYRFDLVGNRLGRSRFGARHLHCDRTGQAIPKTIWSVRDALKVRRRNVC